MKHFIIIHLLIIGNLLCAMENDNNTDLNFIDACRLAQGKSADGWVNQEYAQQIAAVLAVLRKSNPGLCHFHVDPSIDNTIQFVLSGEHSKGEEIIIPWQCQKLLKLYQAKLDFCEVALPVKRLGVEWFWNVIPYFVTRTCYDSDVVQWCVYSFFDNSKVDIPCIMQKLQELPKRELHKIESVKKIPLLGSCPPETHITLKEENGLWKFEFECNSGGSFFGSQNRDRYTFVYDVSQQKVIA